MPYTRHERRTLRRVIRCSRPAGRRRAMRKAVRGYKRSYHVRFYWPIRRHGLSWADKVWTVRTSSCESGRDPAKNTGNGFYGAHQWTPSTAAAAGFRVRPDFTTLDEQDVRAVRWRNIAGRGEWPNCG